MPTLTALIEAHEQRLAEPITVPAVVTPKGDAVIAVYRLKRLMADLSPADRAEVVGLAVVELGVLAGPIAEDADDDEDLTLCCRCQEFYVSADLTCPACRQKPAMTASGFAKEPWL